MRTADFDFDLPPELIAQEPAAQRDGSRLLVLERASGQLAHRRFRDLPEYLHPGDVLVLNNSRVLPARLRGSNVQTGGRFEVLLLEELAPNDWWVMLKPGKRARIGTQLRFQPSPLQATVTATNIEGHRRLRFEGVANVLPALDALGEVPLPPYINRPERRRLLSDRERYQTVFAQPPGSVAAPTAGLHFTQSLLAELRARGVQIAFVTLHVGLGTFAPVKSETLSGHLMHEERFELSPETASLIREARRARRRVIAVGTTTLRVLETLAAGACHPSDMAESASPAVQSRGGAPPLRAGAGKTRLFIYPPYDFKAVDALLTNFHLPRSTLLMLVSAFAAPNDTRGRDLVLAAYAQAVDARYRFFSYGDAMLLL